MKRQSWWTESSHKNISTAWPMSPIDPKIFTHMHTHAQNGAMQGELWLSSEDIEDLGMSRLTRPSCLLHFPSIPQTVLR